MHSDNPILKQFGKEVSKRRKEKKISQEKLAELADLHRTYIGAVERGEKNISIINIFKIAQALNVDPKYLIDFKSKP